MNRLRNIIFGTIAFIAFTGFALSNLIDIKQNMNALIGARIAFDCGLNDENRLHLFDVILRNPDRTSKFQSAFLQNIDSEKEWFLMANRLLKSKNSLNGYTRLGCQYITNPDFSEGFAGWTMYNSKWDIFQQTSISGSAVANVAHMSRNGPGHGHISQNWQLTKGCYLFIVLGAAKRSDDLPTLWLYVETQIEGVASGRALIDGRGDQPIGLRSGIFCLEKNQVDSITISPVTLYGDASVDIQSVRLYGLH